MKHLALGGVLLALAITSAGADDMDDLRREAAKSGVTDFEHPMREITSARTAFVVAAERTCAQTGTAMKVTANLGSIAPATPVGLLTLSLPPSLFSSSRHPSCPLP